MNKVWILLLVLVVISVSMSCTSGTNPEGEKSFRVVEIPKREHGYSNFDSVVISSQTMLDSFLKETSFQENMGWNNREDFEEALNNDAVDFGQEALALLRHTEGSGSIEVTFETPVFSGEKLLCRITRESLAIPLGNSPTIYRCQNTMFFKDEPYSSSSVLIFSIANFACSDGLSGIFPVLKSIPVEPLSHTNPLAPVTILPFPNPADFPAIIVGPR